MSTNSSTNNAINKYISTPYIKGASKRIQRILKPFDLYLSNPASNTVKCQLIHLKDKVATHDKCGVVYKIDCMDSANRDIGETGCNLKTRIKEHQKDIRQGKLKTQVQKHFQENSLNFLFR